MTKETCELWKPIPGYPGYKASDQGRIGSCLVRPGRVPRGTRWATGDKISRVLKPGFSTQGYAIVRPRRDGRCHTVKVARLVMLAFRGVPPEGMEVCHNNGVRTDDRLCNLRYDTHLANMREATGASQRKFTLEQAKALRTKYVAGGSSQRALAQERGASESTIRSLLCGDSYADAGGPMYTPCSRQEVST